MDAGLIYNRSSSSSSSSSSSRKKKLPYLDNSSLLTAIIRSICIGIHLNTLAVVQTEHAEHKLCTGVFFKPAGEISNTKRPVQ